MKFNNKIVKKDVEVNVEQEFNDLAEAFKPDRQGVRDIINFLAKHDSPDYGLLNEWASEESDTPLKITEEYSFEFEQKEGGYEGGGEEYWVVIKLVKNGETHSYWKIPGWYQSYDGGELEWSDTYRVYPYTKLVTDWSTDPNVKNHV